MSSCLRPTSLTASLLMVASVCACGDGTRAPQADAATEMDGAAEARDTDAGRALDATAVADVGAGESLDMDARTSENAASTTPDGSNAPDASIGPGARVAFATSSVHSAGEVGGISGANAICAARAAEAALSGSFVAWLSTLSDPVTHRLGGEGEGYVRTDGQRLVERAADLLSGKLLGPLDRDERGRQVSGDAWTGTRADGSAYPVVDCQGFSVAEPTDRALCGSLAENDLRWTESMFPACTLRLRLYCFQL